jgi:hypothetical protein
MYSDLRSGFSFFGASEKGKGSKCGGDKQGMPWDEKVLAAELQDL